MADELRSKAEITALSNFIHKLLDDKEFEQEDIDLWTGVVRGLDWVMREGPPMERALMILRNRSFQGRI